MSLPVARGLGNLTSGQVTIITPKYNLPLMSGFVLEALLTMLLVLVVFATAVDNKVTMLTMKTTLS